MSALQRAGDPVRPDELAALRRLRVRVGTPAGATVGLAVLAGAASVNVPFAREEVDTGYGVLVTPSWLTTVAVTARAVDGCTVSFGVVAPADATVDVLVFRSED